MVWHCILVCKFISLQYSQHLVLSSINRWNGYFERHLIFTSRFVTSLAALRGILGMLTCLKTCSVVKFCTKVSFLEKFVIRLHSHSNHHDMQSTYNARLPTSSHYSCLQKTEISKKSLP